MTIAVVTIATTMITESIVLVEEDMLVVDLATVVVVETLMVPRGNKHNV